MYFFHYCCCCCVNGSIIRIYVMVGLGVFCPFNILSCEHKIKFRLIFFFRYFRMNNIMMMNTHKPNPSNHPLTPPSSNYRVCLFCLMDQNGSSIGIQIRKEKTNDQRFRNSIRDIFYTTKTAFGIFSCFFLFFRKKTLLSRITFFQSAKKIQNFQIFFNEINIFHSVSQLQRQTHWTHKMGAKLSPKKKWSTVI